MFTTNSMDVRILILILKCIVILHERGVEGDCKFATLLKQPPDKNFVYCDEREKWQNARQECEKRGWRLSTIRSENDSSILNEFLLHLRHPPLNVWTGLRLFSNYTSLVQYGKWGDGTAFYHIKDKIQQENESYANWMPREPKEGQDVCVHMRTKSKKIYVWDNWKCSEKRSFFCETSGPVNRVQFRQMGDYILGNISMLPATKENLEAIMTAIDRLLTSPDSEHYKTSGKISRKIVFDFHGFVERYLEGNVYVNRDNIDVTVNISDAKSPLRYGIYKNSGSKIVLHLAESFMSEALTRLLNSSTIQVGSILYKNTHLFQPDGSVFNETHKRVGKGSEKVQRLKAPGMFGEDEIIRVRPHLLSDVVSAQVSNVTLNDMKNPLRVTVEVACVHQPKSPELVDMTTLHEGVRCAFWNTSTNNWSENGCRVVKSSGKCHVGSDKSPQKIFVTCECDHLTHFSAILDTSYTYAPKYVEGLSMISCIVNAFFLLLTTITILAFRHMRTDTNKRIILNIVINVFIINLVFIIGIDNRKNESLCLATSFILHYFTLTSWFWMLVEAIHLFLTLSLKDRNSIKTKNILIICGVSAYVIPAVIAAVTMTSFQRYRSVKFCWLAPSVAGYTLALPVAVILVLNILVALYVMYLMTCGLKLRQAGDKKAWIKLTIRRSICLAFLLGIPWAAGILMLLCQSPESKSVFATVFAICNMLQGVIIYVAFCAMDDRFRKAVITKFANCRDDMIERIPTLASYKVKPVIDQRGIEKRFIETTTSGSTDNVSRKTSATAFSSSPVVRNKLKTGEVGSFENINEAVRCITPPASPQLKCNAIREEEKEVTNDDDQKQSINSTENPESEQDVVDLKYSTVQNESTDDQKANCPDAPLNTAIVEENSDNSDNQSERHDDILYCDTRTEQEIEKTSHAIEDTVSVNTQNRVGEQTTRPFRSGWL